MEIIFIWIKDDNAIWLSDAWDRESYNQNADSFNAKLKKAYKEHGAENVRLQRATVPYDAVEALFQTPEGYISLIPPEKQ